jgi:hypothetical protein
MFGTPDVYNDGVLLYVTRLAGMLMPSPLGWLSAEFHKNEACFPSAVKFKLSKEITFKT